MNSPPLISMVEMIHLMLLCLWGGVVATEGVIELYPYRRRELHNDSIRLHFWIDLLIELPLIAGVVCTGTILVVLAWPLSGLHLVKIAAAAVAISANLACVILVVRRGRALAAGAGEAEMWGLTRKIVISAVVGLPFAAVAAGMGFWLGYQRMMEMIVR